MNPVEEMGLLKMDFLGLRNLDVIDDAVDIIKRSRDIEIDIGEIPLDDELTYKMLAAGDSTGVFQLESEGMREAMKRVNPTEFDDIIALVSLYRPGAMARSRATPGARPTRPPSSTRTRASRTSPNRPTAASSTRNS